MLPYPLTRANRLRLAQAFAPMPRVDISIDCVIEDQMGAAFVDAPDNPTLYMIEQDQFFCYFAGDLVTSAGRDFIGKTPSGRILMAGSPGWQTAVQSVFDERLIQIKRYLYSSDTLTLQHLTRLAQENPHTASIRQIDASLASRDTPFIGLGAFASVDDFLQRGIGFCVLRDDAIIGGAYSSLVCSNAIEVSIVVDEPYRREGIATALCCQLLQWCLEHHLAPHWDAANEESCQLAEKLGYRKEGEYTAFYLK